MRTQDTDVDNRAHPDLAVVRDLVVKAARVMSHPAGTFFSGFTRSGAGTRTAAVCCTGGTLIVFPADCPGRLLPQAASQGVLAALPALLHLGAAGDRFSTQHGRPSFHRVALKGFHRRGRPLPAMLGPVPAGRSPIDPPRRSKNERIIPRSLPVQRHNDIALTISRQNTVRTDDSLQNRRRRSVCVSLDPWP